MDHEFIKENCTKGVRNTTTDTFVYEQVCLVWVDQLFGTVSILEYFGNVCRVVIMSPWDITKS